MNVGRRRLHRMDQAGVLGDADVHLHPEVRLIALLGLVHLRIPFPGIVLSGTGSSDQGGVDDRALLHCHVLGLQACIHRIMNPVNEVVLLQEVTKDKMVVSSGI